MKSGQATPSAMTQALAIQRRRPLSTRPSAPARSVEATAAVPNSGHAQPNTAGSSITCFAITGTCAHHELMWISAHACSKMPAIRAALVITSAATLAMGLVDGLTAWLALRAIAGISSAWALIHMSSWCAHVPVMAKQVIDDPAVFGWAWPLFGTAAVASTLLAGALRRVLSGRRLWMASACVMALGVACPLFIGGLAGILVCALLVGGTFVVATLAGLQVAREVAGGAAHVLLAAMTASFAASQVAGPLIVSYFVQRTAGFGGALLLACAVLTASAVALMIPQEKR